jgi:hypothetical protein
MAKTSNILQLHTNIWSKKLNYLYYKLPLTKRTFSASKMCIFITLKLRLQHLKSAFFVHQNFPTKTLQFLKNQVIKELFLLIENRVILLFCRENSATGANAVVHREFLCPVSVQCTRESSAADLFGYS